MTGRLEIDPNSFHHAQGNISRNFLSERIKLVKIASPSEAKIDPIFKPFELFSDVEYVLGSVFSSLEGD